MCMLYYLYYIAKSSKTPIVSSVEKVIESLDEDEKTKMYKYK